MIGTLVITAGIIYEDIALYGSLRNSLQNPRAASSTPSQQLPPVPEQLGNATKKLFSDLSLIHI